MATTDVELIVNEICAGRVCRDEVKAVGAGGAGCFGDGLAAYGDGIGRRARVNGLGGFADQDAFGDACDIEREMAQRRRVGSDGEVSQVLAEAVVGDCDGVVAGGYGIHLKFTFVAGDGFAFPIGLFGLQDEMRTCDRAVLNVMNNAANCSENSGERWPCKS